MSATTKSKNASLKIIPLGGLDGIGKNMTVFECGNDMIPRRCRSHAPDDSQPGIDLVLPDYTYVLENEDKLRGIVITHGHEDHTGALPYLFRISTTRCRSSQASSPSASSRASSPSSASALPSSARSRAAAM